MAPLGPPADRSSEPVASQSDGAEVGRPRFHLLTAAYNEADNLPRLIASIRSQTWSPDRWLVVSDGSDDGTDRLLLAAAEELPYLEIDRLERQPGLYFGSKVRALNHGLSRLLGDRCDYLGILDADVFPEPGYFKELITRMGSDGGLGISGGLIVQELPDRLEPQRINYGASVAGGLQMFRWACLEQVGPFLPLRYGGEDSAAEITARMHGWTVKTQQDLRVHHRGRVGDSAGGRWAACFNCGRRFAQLGYRPSFEVSRCLSRLHVTPAVVGAIAELAGFVAERLRLRRPVVPDEMVDFLRSEQAERLRSLAMPFGRRAA